MTYQAGSAAVSITPDFKDFHSQVAKELDGLDAQFAKAGDSAGKSFADAFQGQLKASFANLPNAKITADADTTKAKADLDAAAKDRTAKIKVSVDKSALADLAKSPVVLGALGAAAVGPQAIGLGLGVAGLGAAFGAAAVTAGSFGVVAKGMFTDVTKAQTALTAAQKAYNTATTDAGRAKALADEKAALDGLTPAEQQLATQLTTLKGAWSDLSKAEQPVVGAALTPWLQTATSGMQLLTPLIEDGAGAFQLLGTEAKSALSDQFWGTFSNTLGTTGQIALVNFGEALGKVGDGLAHLFVTFAPDIDKVIPLVNQAAGAFDKWARSVTAGGLEDFFSKTFSPANVAALKSDLGNVATIVGNIAKAGADLSPTAFSGLSNLLAVAAKLSPGQIEALAALYGAGKTVGGAGNLAKLLTGGASLSLPTIGKGAKKTTAKTAAAAEEEAPAKAGKFAKAGKVAGAAAGVVPVLGAASVIDQAIPKGPGGEWVNSWAPYEKIFTNDLPKAWSISYEAFQVEFAGPMTNWFTNSLPHFFTAQIPMGWSTAYEAFQRDFAGPLTSWFTTSLPNFFTQSIPANVWSPAFEGFMNDIGSPIANFFTSTLPSFFTDAGSWLVSAGQSVANGFVSGWNATEGAITGAFTAGKNWVTGAYADAVSWLTSAGNDVASGFVRAWNATQGAITGAFGAAKNWVSAQFSGAVSWLTSAGNDVASGFVRAWNATQGAITGAFAAAKDWVSAQFSAAASWLTAAGNNVSSGFVRAWDATEGAVTGAAGRAKGWVTSVFSGAAGWLTSAGEAVVRGLANAISGASGLVTSAISSIGNAVKSGLSGLGIPGFASGTPSAPPGWAWVGEKGPELMHLAGGEQVLTHSASLAKAQSMASLASMNVPSVSAAPRLPGVSAPLSAGPLQMQVSWAGTNDQVTNAVVGGLQFHIQANAGGDVQAALGRGQVRIQ